MPALPCDLRTRGSYYVGPRLTQASVEGRNTCRAPYLPGVGLSAAHRALWISCDIRTHQQYRQYHRKYMSSTPFLGMVFDKFSLMPLGKYRRRHFQRGMYPGVIVIRDCFSNLVDQFTQRGKPIWISEVNLELSV